MSLEKKHYKLSNFKTQVNIAAICLLLILNFLIGLSIKAALTISSPASASLTGKTVSISAQDTTGTISGVEVIDDGTAGWTATITSTHFTRLAPYKLLAGNNDTVTFSGDYDGLDGVLDPNGTFIVEITTGGAVATAQFKWTDPADNETTGVATASTVVLSNGISVAFAATTYVAGDKWSAGVDVFPYTGLTVTPGTITVVSGDTGVNAGTSGALAGTGATSDAKTIMTGEAGNSAGTYQQDEGLSLDIHANSLSGSFTATATLTVL